MTLEETASRLQKAKPRRILGCPGYSAACPAHEDKSPSLGVWESADGWLHFKCQTGCSEDAILSALSMTQEDRRVHLNGSVHKDEREVIYEYHDADGLVLFEKRRFYKDGKKSFQQRIRKPDGSFIYSLESLKGKAKTLYRWPEVKAAMERGDTVYINEGEKACEAFRARGLCGTCQPGGAQEGNPGSKWLPQHTQALKGAAIVVVADRDRVGQEYARYVVAALEGVATSVKLVQSAHAADKADAFDHFAAGFGPGDFLELGAEDFDPVPAGIQFSNGDFEPVELEYLWEPRMPIGKIILWDADGGTQKTTLLAAISAGLSIGQLPNGDGECEPVRTAYFHKGEDEDREIATVFAANGGDFKNIVFYNLPRMNLDADGLLILERIVRKEGFKHVVFDALFYFCQHLKNEGWKDPMAPLPILEGLKDVARQTRCCISDLRHTSKGKADKEASEMGFGSVQFRNSHRGQMVMRYHPKPMTDQEQALVIVTDEKGCLLSPRASAFAFKRKGNAVEYISEFDNPFDARDTIDGRKAKRVAAGQWLTSVLLAGPRDSKDVFRMGQEAGFNKRTLYRVLDEIRGYSSVDGFGSTKRATWSLTDPRVFDPFEED